MHTIQFHKMHGLGNDFLLINSLNQSPTHFAPLNLLSNRHRGIGFDQLLLIKSSSRADFSCQIFNADGSEAEQCGNGMRCVARYIIENNLSDKKNLSIETKAGIVKIKIHDFDRIEVNMGQPKLEGNHDIQCDDKTFKFSKVSVGNPHAIITIPTIKDFPIEKYGSLISKNAIFPNGTNVGFMEIANRQHIRLRTYERGVGPTLACGSNACAAVAAGINNQLLDPKVTVELELGSLEVELKNQEIFLTGPATKVFEGTIEIQFSKH